MQQRARGLVALGEEAARNKEVVMFSSPHDASTGEKRRYRAKPVPGARTPPPPVKKEVFSIFEPFFQLVGTIFKRESERVRETTVATFGQLQN
jgi:hypothetical protein